MDNNTDVEKQIMEQQKTVDFDTREFTIEILVNKHITGLDDEKMNFMFLIINVNLFGMKLDNLD